MMYEANPQLAADMQGLSLDETDIPSEHDAKAPRKTAKTPPVRVNCKPLPPKEEYDTPRSTGIYYYGFYVGNRSIEKYGVKVNPELANADISLQYQYGLDYLRALVGDRDESLRVHIAIIRRRHKKAMPFITQRKQAPFLALFPLEWEAYVNRMSARKVEKLAEALGCRPEWFEIAMFI
ncbi:hypothetical protein L227DRAFT_581821, partial [Lentinus tigrinus ALCF2SS1-6]